ncbi:MAG: MerR family transcriptional regulator [Bacillota bacterium]|nr:MerR family transcriptional regulator [Bacillota bacterium]
MGKKYRISEVAELLGVSASAIRFYEKKGLFKAKKDEENGYRSFDEKDIKKIWSIIYHRNIDMSLDTINHLKHTESLAEVIKIVEGQRQEVKAKIAAEEKRLQFLDFYREILSVITENLGIFSPVDTGDMHLFAADYLYKPKSAISTVGHTLTVFQEDGRYLDYMLVHDEFMPLLPPEEAEAELRVIDPFKALYTIAQRQGGLDGAGVLGDVLKDAAELGYKVKPPYYVLYLVSAGEWSKANRFYELFLTLDE